MKLSLLISSVIALVVFLITYVIEYFRLLHMQPSNGKLPENFTSFPPSSAWMVALPWGLITFIVAFLILLLVFKKR